MTSPNDSAPDRDEADDARRVRDVQARLARHVRAIATSWKGATRAASDPKIRTQRVKSDDLIAQRYRLQSILGSGGNGQVWTAFDQQLERRVAIKILFDGEDGGLAMDERLDRERKALARVSHPGVVEIREASSDGDIHYLVMRLVEGPTIRDVIDHLAQRCQDGEPKQSPRTADLVEIVGNPSAGVRAHFDPASYYRSVAQITIELLRGLEAAHERKVVHRDLKPENVVLTPGGAPVVLDFGLAADLLREPGRLTEGLAGTPGHFAPEQIATRRTGNQPAIDVFQVGTILFEMLTLERPYSRREVVPSAATRHATEVLPRVPVELGDIAACAMSESRYASASAFRADLERFASRTELPHASRNLPGRRGLRLRYLWNRRRSWILAGAALLVIGGLTFTVASLTNQRIEFAWERVGEGRILRLHVDASIRAKLLPFIVWSDAEGKDRYYLPLRDSAAFGIAARDGRSVLELQFPDEAREEASRSNLSQSDVVLQYAANASQADAQQRLGVAVAKWMRVEDATIGVPEAVLRQIIERDRSSTKGSGKAALELSTDELLGLADASKPNSGLVRGRRLR